MVNGSRLSNVGANSDSGAKADLSSASLTGVALLQAYKLKQVMFQDVLHAVKARSSEVLARYCGLSTGMSVQEEELSSGAQHIPLMDEEHLDTDASTDKVCSVGALVHG